MGLIRTVEELKKNGAEVPNAPQAGETSAVDNEGTANAGAGVGAGNVGDGKDKNTAFVKFKQTGVSVREQMTEEQKALEGSKSGAVKFITALGNPKKPVKRVQGGERLPSYEVVGYKFEALEPVQVPTCLPKKGAKSNMDVEPPTWREVKAGEQFDLSCAELGVMIAGIEYAGIFNGGGDEVILHVTISKARGGVPNTVLKRREGALKSDLTLIADKEKGENGKSTYTVKPEYAEKFGYLFVQTPTNRGTAGATKVGESPRELAAALRVYSAKQYASK